MKIVFYCKNRVHICYNNILIIIIIIIIINFCVFPYGLFNTQLQNY
jgi:hypothetical protein